MKQKAADAGKSVNDFKLTQEQVDTVMSGSSDSAKSMVKGYNGAKVSVEELGRSSIAASAGIKLLSMAGNMLLSFAVSFVISKIAEKIYEVGTAATTAKENSESLASSLSKMQSEYAENSSKIDELSKKYDELSSGVNDAGLNVSLTSSQYDEYKSVIKQLSEIMPELTTRFNEQGEAIGFVGGKLKDTKKKYQEYQQNEAKKILSEGKDDKTYDDVVDNFNNQKTEKSAWEQTATNIMATFSDDAKLEMISNQDKIDNLQKIIDIYNYTDKDKAVEKIKELFLSSDGFGKNGETFTAMTELVGKNLEEIGNLNSSKLEEFIGNLISIQESLRTDQDNSANAVREMMRTDALSKDEYWSDKLGDTGRSYVNSVLSGISYDFLNEEELNTKEGQQSFVTNLINTIKNNKGNVNEAFASLFELNLDDMNIDDAREKIQQYCSIIAEVLEISLPQAQELLGYDAFFGTAENYDKVVAYATDGSYKSAKDVKNSKGFDEKQILDLMDKYSINSDEEIDNFRELLEKSNTISELESKLANKTTSSFKSFKEAWADLDTASEDSGMKDTKQDLLDLAEAGKLTEKTFKEVSGSDTFLDEIGISSKKAIDNINHLVESTKQLSSMKTGISSITSAYDEKKDSNDNRVGVDTLSSMYDTLGVSEWTKPDLEVWEQYKKVASDSKSTLKDLKTAQDNLATSFVNSDNYLSNITEDTYDYYVGLLKEMGVTNAEEVATRALNQSKIDAKIATIDLAVATDGEVSSLANYITALDDSSNSLAYYTLQKQITNNNALDSSKSIENLKALAEQCGITGEAIALMSSMAANMKQVEEYTTGSKKNDQHAGDVITNANSELTGQKKRLNKVIKQNVKTGVGTKIKTSGGNQDKKDKNSSSKDKSKSTQVIDWIERRLNRLNSTIDYTTSKLQNMFTIKQKSNEIDKQIKTSTKLINAYGIAADKYKKKANQVAKSSTKTVTNSKGKKKKKKVSGLSDTLIKNIQNGKLKSKSLSKLIATYGEDTAGKIQSYQDYWDKYQDALKNKQDEIAKKRQYQIDKEQIYVDKADAKYNKNEALKENAKSAAEKNTILKDERENLKDSYKHQIEIAKINKDKVEQARLNAELQKKLNDIAIEQHQNVVDELDRNNDALEAQKQNLKTASEKNAIVDQQKAIAQQTYAEQIEIAKLQYGDGSDEVKKLQEEQKSKLADFENEKFENIQTEYGNWLDMIQSRIDGLDGSISIVEAKGITATQGLYQGKVAVEKENLSTLQAEKAALEEQHKSTEVGTALWYSQEKSLNDVSTAITNAQKNMIEYRNSIREANDKVLELKKSFIDLGNIYLDNFEKYLSRYSLTDEDTGGLTDKGVATLGIYRKQSISAGEQQKIDMDKLNEIEDIIARYNIYDDTQKKILLETNNYDSFAQVKEDYEKYAQAVQDDISNRISAEENIINLMKERYNAELSYIQKLIDDRKQQLSDEKDLHDYQKSIQEKVDNISLLQKQLDALRNDGSEEAMQRRNNIQDQLDNSKEDLTDVEYDKYISDQQNMLDKLSEDYQNLIEDLLQDVDTLLNEGNEIAKNNGDKFEKAINGFTEKYGQTPFTQQQIDVAAIKTAVEKEQKDQDAANEVLSAIEKIGTVDLNGEGRGRLVNAENLYKSLTDAQRKIVDENPNGLTLLQKKQQEWVALQAPTQTSIPTSQPSSTPQQSATEAKRAEERKNQQKAQFEQLIKNTYWQNAKYGTKKLFKDNGKETDYTKVQKKIAKNYKRDDFKYVNADWIKEVCKRLGIAQSAGSLLNYMNGIGFSKGGIVETLSKVPGRNGDDGWATLQRGEAILTPEQTKMFQSMIKQMPVFTNAMDIFSSTKSSTGVNNKPNSVSVGDINLTLDLPNVTDSESFIKEMQSNSRMRKVVQQAVLDEVVGKGNFNIKRL